jgi:multidrug efflux system membrane fusion protein
MRVRLVLLIVLIAVLGGGGFLIYSHQRGTAAQAPAGGNAEKAVPVSVAVVQEKAAPVQIRTVGRIQTLASVAVRSRIDGVISSVTVADGQEVKAGDELFRIDDREAQATLKLAQANLGKDQASLANAKRQVDRLTPLAAKNFTTKQDYDAATTLVATLQATIAADQAAIDAAKVTVSYTIIRAPITGRIGTVALKLGNSVRSTCCSRSWPPSRSRKRAWANCIVRCCPGRCRSRSPSRTAARRLRKAKSPMSRTRSTPPPTPSR